MTVTKFASCHCGAKWLTHQNMASHCAGCHETFASNAGFDRHQSIHNGANLCAEPARMLSSTGEPLYACDTPGPQCGNGVVWRLIPTVKQQASLDRLRDRKKANV